MFAADQTTARFQTFKIKYKPAIYVFTLLFEVSKRGFPHRQARRQVNWVLDSKIDSLNPFTKWQTFQLWKFKQASKLYNYKLYK